MPTKAPDMLRWLATLSYQSISSRATEFLSDHGLLEDVQIEPFLRPKDAVFSVSALKILLWMYCLL